jgi:isoquinoline 1-oxidoreductase
MLPRPRRPWDKTPPEERDYFDTLGDGLVAVLPARRPEGSSEEEWSPPTGGAWVHIGADGSVRGFTGKVEVGQGTRTALSLVVAEELRLPLTRVEIVVGDTDLSPWDMGTFGSRSMPDAAPALRAVAATAREALREIASAALRRAPDQLLFEDGSVHVAGTTQAVPYADLVRSLRKTVLAGPGVTGTPAPEWRRAGHSATDPHAEDVVTGRRLYVSDLRREGMLYGNVLHPPRQGARLVDVTLPPDSPREPTQFVRDGDFVGVVAPTPWEAGAALRQVRATWEETPQPREAEIEPYLRAHPSQGDGWDVDEHHQGDPRRALASAAVTVKATYRTAYIAHVPLETRAALAEWEGSRLTIWLGTQTPFRARDHVAGSLGIPVEDVRVIAPYTGAGFGGKHGGDVALEAARLSRAAHRPVQVTYSREEEFQHGYLRPLAIMDLEAGAAQDGTLTAWIFHNVNAGASALRPPYAIANLKVSNELSDSPLPQGAYRSLAAVANNFARESAVDELAAALGWDPLVLRERNLRDERLLEVLHRVADRVGWAHRARVPGRGHGLALGREKGGRVATAAEVEVGEDRGLRVTRLVTAFEAGAVVHPDNLRSQVEGAAAMALGGALFEAIHFDSGQILNPRLSQYRVPRFLDVPSVEAILVDRPDQPSAGGGETPMITIAPAIANAIFDATGDRMRSLPLAPGGHVPRVPREPR